MNTLLLLTLFLAGSLLLQATILWLAVRLCSLPRRSWIRALLVAVLRLVVVVALWLVLVGRDGDTGMTPVFWAGAFVADVFLTLWLVHRLFGGRARAVFGAWAVHAIANVIVGTGLGFLTQTCLAGYAIPASSMSPNIRGFHVVEVLPDGNHLIVAANDPADPYGIPAGGPSRGIVEETFESRETPRPAGYAAQADRILCNKTKVPERWDAVVFRYPREPTVEYVKRLVGLPGERIAIRDGAVWVDGDRQTPPARLGPIRYRAGFGRDEDDVLTEEVGLGPDEFFVLGDNTNKSSDSRDWGPVKRDLILGVADLIYWPPARWRVGP